MSKKSSPNLRIGFSFCILLFPLSLEVSLESVGCPCRTGFGKYAQVFKYCSITCLINEIAYISLLMSDGTEKDGFFVLMRHFIL